jgi:hypothetical protein
MDNYVVDPETGCWLWQGYRDPTGYPYHTVDGRFVSARRWHYEQHYGPIPDGLRLALRCGNRLCVKATHLEAVVPRVILRGKASTKLDVGKVRDIRVMAGQVPQRVIAERFGISLSQVNHILRGRSWNDVEAEPAPPA